MRTIKIMLFIILMALSAQGAYAVCSGMPDAFYGSLEINSQPAPPGTEMRAVLMGVVRGNYTTHLAGMYGNATGDDKLYVYGSSNGSDFNQNITFEARLNGTWVDSGERSVYQCGVVKLLDLDIEQTDDDLDGYLNFVDCDDGNSSINPGAQEVCNGVDDNCDSVIDENASALCGDGLFCNGEEVCLGAAGCAAGAAVDCSAFSHPGISTCGSIPDDNPFTWDYLAPFTSVCSEEAGQCTTYASFVSHTCNASLCGAECESDLDCGSINCTQQSGCVNGTYREYNTSEAGCYNCQCRQCSDAYYEVVTDSDMDGADVECELDCDDEDENNYPGNDELCDYQDNDCDSLADEDFPSLGESCMASIYCDEPECNESGVYICNEDGSGVVCSTSEEVEEEICDGYDNDYDGDIDEEDVCACEDDLDCPEEWTCSNQSCVMQTVCELDYPLLLEAGWNLIGFPSCTPMPVTEALSSIEGSYGDIFTLESGEWKNYNPEAPEEMNTLETLKPIQGVYIFMNEADTLVVPE